MNGFLAAVLLCVVPADGGPLKERCDLVEWNHFYDEKGRLVFDQLIFYNWDPVTCRHQAAGWRTTGVTAPFYDWGCGCWRAVWWEGSPYGVMRDVMAGGFKETWTQYDPELYEREHRPKEMRPDLRRVPNAAKLDAAAAAIMKRRSLHGGTNQHNPPEGPAPADGEGAGCEVRNEPAE
jgi:hypothetical protein